MASQKFHGLVRAACMAAAVMVGGAADARAQDTRAEAIAQEKARKAADLKPYVPSRAEKIVTAVTNGLVALPDGIYPAFGSVYAGGGLAAGPGARAFIGDRSYVEGRAMLSIRQYKLVEGSIVMPDLARGRLHLRGDAGWLDATQVGFFGLGMASSADDRANFRMKQGFARVRAEVRPAGPFFAAATIGIDDYTLERGKGTQPSIEDRFTAATAPALDADPAYTRFSGSTGLDWRPASGYARRGGLYTVGFHAWRDRDDTHSFDRVDAEVVQHLPLLRENWVLSLHGRMQSTVGDTDVVPYFLLPSLGSGSTLRGYSTGRFRDRHALLIQAEWRWIVNRSGLDLAFFYDMGKVGHRRADLDLSGLKSNVGFGFRFHGPMATPLRIEIARGNEGFNLVFAAGAAF